jgi:hypothetical protein
MCEDVLCDDSFEVSDFTLVFTFPTYTKAQVAGTCECGNETSGSIGWGVFWVAENRLNTQEGVCSIEQVKVNTRKQRRSQPYGYLWYKL